MDCFVASLLAMTGIEREILIASDTTIVPSGVVQLMELQEQGWSCIRP